MESKDFKRLDGMVDRVATSSGNPGTQIFHFEVKISQGDDWTPVEVEGVDLQDAIINIQLRKPHEYRLSDRRFE